MIRTSTYEFRCGRWAEVYRTVFDEYGIEHGWVVYQKDPAVMTEVVSFWHGDDLAARPLNFPAQAVFPHGYEVSR